MTTNMPSSFFDWVLFLLKEYGGLLVEGAIATLMLAVVGTFIGCIIGLIVGAIQTIKVNPKANPVKKALNKGLQTLLTSYVEIFRGTPMIVQAMLVYYGSMYLFEIDMSAMFAGFLVVSVNTGAYMAETVRGGISSIDIGQTEAAKAIGMNHYQTMKHVILPQALRNIMPQIGNNLIINIKDTSVLNVISVTELYFVSKSAAGVYYKYFEVFFITCVIYFIMTFSVSCILKWIEKKMDGPDNYALVEYDPMADPCGPFTSKKGSN
ncbi:MAG: amino acid ABC transporter permease [Negativicutes bacterium]|jgi:putative lysine transport system permease protein|nr:amino acid ABC transporter permease [Negativicutes bacterium]MBP8629390.1 amino acid ABC transporter permease [Negativicutes bacterium]MBP9537385.1 amino acid ABC transporter permease [Negativicutes bacterium]MBP9949439.1 amino acid ABC transporter permease [Negativicutes bacterium]